MFLLADKKAYKGEYSGEEAREAELLNRFQEARRGDVEAAEIVTEVKEVLKHAEIAKATTSAAFSKAKREYKDVYGG